MVDAHNPTYSITLNDAGKRFNREWIFRHVSFVFESGKTYAITGPNGSGKSTLLQAIAGSMHVSEGTIIHSAFPQIPVIDPELVYRHLSISAPYLELVEEMTAKEFLEFHQQFKPFFPSVSVTDILHILGLERSADKQMRYFSSGMKQRIKLAQAVFSNVPVLLLDEPCTNLDASGYELYHSLLENYCADKLIIISSNDEMEIDICQERLGILDYK